MIIKSGFSIKKHTIKVNRNPLKETYCWRIYRYPPEGIIQDANIMISLSKREFGEFCQWMDKYYKNYQIGYFKCCLKENLTGNTSLSIYPQVNAEFVRQEFKDWINWKYELGDNSSFLIVNRFSKNTNVYGFDNIMKRYFKQQNWAYISLDSLPKIAKYICNSLPCPICNNIIISIKPIAKCTKCKSLIRM